MKKALIPVILLLAMLAGCGEEEEEVEVSDTRVREPKVEQEEPTPTEDPGNPGVIAEPETKKPEFIPLKLDTHRQSVYDPDIAYKLWFEGSYDELVLDCDDYYAMKYTLDELNSNMKESVENAKDEYTEYAPEDNGFEDDWSYYYFLNCDTTINRADTNVVSLSQLWSSYAGGVHPDSYYSAMVYDTASGKKLSLWDIVDTYKKDEMLELIEKKALENNPDLEDMLLSDLGDTLNDMAADDMLTFGLDTKGLTFYFSPYEIAAYAAGSTIVTIGYDEIPGLINEEYKQLPEDYFFDLGHTTQKDVFTITGGREVSFWIEEKTEDEFRTHIYLNGAEFEFDDYGWESVFYLAHKDGKDFLYRETVHENDYRDTAVFDLNSDEPEQVDTIFAAFTEGLYNPDNLQMTSRGDLLSTYTIENDYAINYFGSPIPMNDYYLIKTWEEPWTITLKQDMEAEARDEFIESDEYIYPMQLNAGDKLSFYATDGETWVDFKTEGGSFVRVYVDTDDYPQSVNGVDIDELFDGIMFAG